jgi:hypothetical protein
MNEGQTPLAEDITNDPKYKELKAKFTDFVETTWQVFVAAQSKIGLWPEHEKQFEQLWKQTARDLEMIP